MFERVLYMDLEWDEITQEIKSIQMKFDGEEPIILYPPFNTEKIEEISVNWNKIHGMDGVISFHNALPDIGHLSTLPGNSGVWKNEEPETKEKYRKDSGKKRTGGCLVNLFGHEYLLVNLNGRSNLIIPTNDKKSPYIKDTSKLFGLFIDDSTSKLKELCPKYLGYEMIPYTKENAETIEYQVQDVVVPEQLWGFFREKMKNVPDLGEYSNKDFARVCTTATTTRKAAEKAYPEMSKWQNWNYKEIVNWGLDTAFERAYMGGLTCSMYRCSQKHGPVKDTAWFDIKASYANVMKYENVDQYNKFVMVKTDPCQPLARNNHPLFCRVVTNCVFRSVEDSLKVFEVEEKFETVMWSPDILSLRILFPNADITIVEAWKPIGLNFVTETLSGKWIEEKNQCEKGTAPYLHAKTKSNAYYGVRAQRDPNPTKFTNMLIAGITTSRARLTLCEMVDEARKMGCQWLYSDTDSICVKLNGVNPNELLYRLNKRIAPYECECEFIGNTFVIAVKRYVATNGVDLMGNPVKDKISVHGRGQYDVEKEEIKRMVEKEIINRKLKLRNVQANTERTYNRVLNLESRITNPCPFMFLTDVQTDIVLQDWFDNTWFPHLDTKTTWDENYTIENEFVREFPKFRTLEQAEDFYKNYSGYNLEDGVLTEDGVIDWDRDDKIYFKNDPVVAKPRN